MDKLNNSVDRIKKLSKGLEKDDPYIHELIDEIKSLKKQMINILEEDSRKKAAQEQPDFPLSS
jgi:hypothetical protein